MDAGGAGAFGNDEVRQRTDRRKVAGQGRAHSNHEPDAVLIGKPQYERLERQDRRHIAGESLQTAIAFSVQPNMEPSSA